MVDAPIEKFDEHGLGQEPNNLAAINSLVGYRALRFGRNVELIITDQRSYRSEEPSGLPGAEKLSSDDFPFFTSEEALKILDAGRAYNNAPESIRFGQNEVENFRRNSPPQTILGARQKEWFIQKLRASKATWKIWGNSIGTLEMRADLQNLPGTFGKQWPASGYACTPNGDWACAYAERAEIYDAVQRAGITGFVDRGRRSPQLLGGLGRQSASARSVRAGGNSFHHRFDFSTGPCRSDGAQNKQGPCDCVRSFSRTLRARKSQGPWSIC